jgi:hypothetical protein
MPISCYYHSACEAVYTCSQCGKPICQSCIHSYSPVWCTVCVDAYHVSQQKAEARKAKKTLLIIGISFIVGVLLFSHSSDNLGTVLLKGYVCSGVYPAWTLLPKVPKLNTDFQFLGLLVFILYPIAITITLVCLLFLLSLKFVVSAFLGLFIVPFKVYQSIKALQ